MFRMSSVIHLRRFLGLCPSVSMAGVICWRTPWAPINPAFLPLCALRLVSVCRDIPLPQVCWEVIWFHHELIKERAPCRHSWINEGLRGPCYWFNITLPLNIQDTQAQAKRSWSCVFMLFVPWHQHFRDLCFLKSWNKTSDYWNIWETHLSLHATVKLTFDSICSCWAALLFLFHVATNLTDACADRSVRLPQIFYFVNLGLCESLGLECHLFLSCPALHSCFPLTCLSADFSHDKSETRKSFSSWNLDSR